MCLYTVVRSSAGPVSTVVSPPYAYAGPSRGAGPAAGPLLGPDRAGELLVLPRGSSRPRHEAGLAETARLAGLGGSGGPAPGLAGAAGSLQSAGGGGGREGGADGPRLPRDLALPAPGAPHPLLHAARPVSTRLDAPPP